MPALWCAVRLSSELRLCSSPSRWLSSQQFNRTNVQVGACIWQGIPIGGRRGEEGVAAECTVHNHPSIHTYTHTYIYICTYTCGCVVCGHSMRNCRVHAAKSNSGRERPTLESPKTPSRSIVKLLKAPLSFQTPIHSPSGPVIAPCHYISGLLNSGPKGFSRV